MQDVTQGVERLRAWPATRGKPKTKAQAEAQELFRIVQKAAAYLAPEALAYIHKATANSPLLVRDVVTMQLYNRWMQFLLPDGRMLSPMPAINDVSEALDVLSRTVGDYLVRTSAGWRGRSTLPPAGSNIQQAEIWRNSFVAGVGGGQSRVPFNYTLRDQGGWWKGAPDFHFAPGIAGKYHFELCVRKTANNIAVARLDRVSDGANLAWGNDIANQRTVALSTFLQLDEDDAVTSFIFNNAGGTIEGYPSAVTYFRCTGPF